MTWVTLDAVSPPPRATGPRITMAMRKNTRLRNEMVYLTWASPPPWFGGGAYVSVDIGTGADIGYLRISAGGTLRVTQMPCPAKRKIISCGIRFYRWTAVLPCHCRSTVVEFESGDSAVVIKLPSWAQVAEAVDQPTAILPVAPAPVLVPVESEVAPQKTETLLWSPSRIDALRRQFDAGVSLPEIGAALNALPGPHLALNEINQMITDGEMKRTALPAESVWTPEREACLSHNWPLGVTITEIQAKMRLLAGSLEAPIGAEIMIKVHEMGLQRPGISPMRRGHA